MGLSSFDWPTERCKEQVPFEEPDYTSWLDREEREQPQQQLLPPPLLETEKEKLRVEACNY